MIRLIPNDPMLPGGTDRCRCTVCGEYFGGSGTFALHRVGGWKDHGKDRRCLSVAEMTELGWLHNVTGHWIRGKRPASVPTRPETAAISFSAGSGEE